MIIMFSSVTRDLIYYTEININYLKVFSSLGTARHDIQLQNYFVKPFTFYELINK